MWLAGLQEAAGSFIPSSDREGPGTGPGESLPVNTHRMEDCPQPPPLFSLGVIADIQYADCEDGFNYQRTRRRFYRSSLQLLSRAQESWSRSDVLFILQLGDIIDGSNRRRDASEGALQTVLRQLGPPPEPPGPPGQVEVIHVWGNHEFYNFSRTELLTSQLNSTLHTDRKLLHTDRKLLDTDRKLLDTDRKLLHTDRKLQGEIYAFGFSPFPGFTFIVLDAYDVSLLGRDESSDQYRDALSLIRQHNDNEDLNSPPGSEGLQQRFTMFNGGFSKDQLDWLDSVLSSADDKRERVTIVSHLPVHPCSTDAMCLAWNYDELLAIIRSHSSVVCFMAGHDHDGGYHLDKDTGVHHLTLEGVIETPPDSNAFGTVSVYEDRMVLKGNGRIRDRVLLFPCRPDTS